jgi:hypothetical protein
MKMKVKTMTTNRNLDHLSGANRKRVKHPARSARILTSGFSIAAVLGIASGYSLAEINKVAPVDEKSFDPSVDESVLMLQDLVGPAAAVASQSSRTVAPAQTTPLVVVVAPQLQTKVKRQTIQVQVSAASSGSK